MLKKILTLVLMVSLLMVASSTQAASLLLVKKTIDSPIKGTEFQSTVEQLRKDAKASVFSVHTVPRGFGIENIFVLEGDYKKLLTATKKHGLKQEEFELFDESKGDSYSIKIGIATSFRIIIPLRDRFPDTFERKFKSLNELKNFIERWKPYPINGGQDFPLRAWIKSRNFKLPKNHKFQSHYLVGIYGHSRGKTHAMLSCRSSMDEYYHDPTDMYRVILPRKVLKDFTVR